MQFFSSLSKHEYLIFKALVNELVSTALDDTDFSFVFMRYKKLCTFEGLIPLSLNAAFYHIQEMASFVFFNLIKINYFFKVFNLLFSLLKILNFIVKLS
jgi:hypothetical protein